MSRVRSFSETPPAIAPESCPPCPGSSMTSAKGSPFLCWGTTRRGENGSGVRRRVKNDTIINKRPSHTIISLALVETRKRTILFRDQRCQFIRSHGTISHRHVCITLQHRRRNCPISKSLAPLPPDFCHCEIVCAEIRSFARPIFSLRPERQRACCLRWSSEDKWRRRIRLPGRDRRPQLLQSRQRASAPGRGHRKSARTHFSSPDLTSSRQGAAGKHRQ